MVDGWMEGWTTCARVSSRSLPWKEPMWQCLAAWTTGCLSSYGKTPRWNVNQVSQILLWPEHIWYTADCSFRILESFFWMSETTITLNCSYTVYTVGFSLTLRLTACFSLIAWVGASFFEIFHFIDTYSSFYLLHTADLSTFWIQLNLISFLFFYYYSTVQYLFHGL